MLTRTVLAACLLLGAVAATYAAEESSNRGDNPQPDARSQVRRPSSPPPSPAPQVRREAAPPPPVFRQPPPPPPRREVYREPSVIYRPAPTPPRVILRSAPTYGYICQTRRFECELRRPLPLGAECECRTPSGSFRPGEVVP